MAEQSVTLQPGEGKVVTFEAIPHEAKTYQVSVDGLSGSFEAIETITNLHGVVTNRDTGAPIAGATVILYNGVNKEVNTNSEGFYLITDFIPGTYRLYYHYRGYSDVYQTRTLHEGDNEINIMLNPR